VRVLVKLGGSLLENLDARAAIAGQLAHLARDHQVVVVHGGGKQVTRFLEKEGVKSRFVNGLRVSDSAVIEAVVSIIAGRVNKGLVAALLAADVPALGISGIDGQLTRAEELNPELGFVGRPVSTNGTLLEILQNAGYVPVVACIAADNEGTIFNVNADEMAVSCAAAYHAHRLIFLTDVPGVKNGDGQIIPNLAFPAAAGLIRSGVAQGGMRAKLEAAIAAIKLGIPQIYIAPGSEVNICGRLLAGEPLGTRISS